MSESRPTKLVRVRDLVKGDVLVRYCTLEKSLCVVDPEKHVEGTRCVTHEFTVIEIETNNDLVDVVALTEAGDRTAFSQVARGLVRVYAD